MSLQLSSWEFLIISFVEQLRNCLRRTFIDLSVKLNQYEFFCVIWHHLGWPTSLCAPLRPSAKKTQATDAQ